MHGLLGHTGSVRPVNGRIKVEYGSSRELSRYLSLVYGLLTDVCKKSGVKLLLTSNETTFDMSTTLLLGTCSMADSIDDGVVNPDGQVFNCPGLYITDGSVIPGSLGINPYFTIAANAERLSTAIIADQ